jgi:hypothetical protein
MNIYLPFKKSLLIFPIVLLGFQITEAQNIVVPPADKSKASPLVFNAESASAGKTIYDMNCVSCHGTPGMGNNLKGLNPVPIDLGTTKAQDQTDGDLFYKISEGNAIMPKFKTTLPENDRWKLVAYIRSFNKTYVQPAIQKGAGNLLSKAVRVKMSYDAQTGKVLLLVRAFVKNDSIPLKGSDVLLFVKRYFGNLPIGEASKTDDKGIASFDFPKNIPGDKEGNILLLPRITDAVYGEISASQKLKIGVPTDLPSLTEKRAIWNVMAKAPIWLLITFFSILTVVWLIIVYIVFNIYRIKRLSKTSNH